MYDFDMRQLLETFDGDPEKLANAFTEQLNEALAEKKKKEEIEKLASTVALTWDTFVSEYTAFNKLNIDPAEYHLNGEDVESIFILLVALRPEVEKYVNAMEKINSATEKIKPVVENTINDFDKAMKNFFRKNNI